MGHKMLEISNDQTVEDIIIAIANWMGSSSTMTLTYLIQQSDNDHNNFPVMKSRIIEAWQTLISDGLACPESHVDGNKYYNISYRGTKRLNRLIEQDRLEQYVRRVV